MEPNPPKFKVQARAGQEELTGQDQQSVNAVVPHEFATPEDMLRFDAAQTGVPPLLAERLQDSIAQEPANRPSWWRRLWPQFRGGR